MVTIGPELPVPAKAPDVIHDETRRVESRLDVITHRPFCWLETSRVLIICPFYLCLYECFTFLCILLSYGRQAQGCANGRRCTSGSYAAVGFCGRSCAPIGQWGSQSACLADSMSTGHPRSFPTETERGSAKVNKADLRSDRG